MIAVLSGASAGAASTTFDGPPVAEADALAGADAGSAVPAAMGSADVVWAAAGAAVFGNAAAAADAVGAATFAAGVIAG